jgi:hypothetical protein
MNSEDMEPQRENLWAKISDRLDAWESPAQRERQWTLALLGALGTVAMWWAHLSRLRIPDFKLPFGATFKAEIPVLLFLVPPYLMVFGLAHALGSRDSEAAESQRVSGPLSGYLQQEESARKWKIRLWAGGVAVGNLLMMIFTSGPER